MDINIISSRYQLRNLSNYCLWIRWKDDSLAWVVTDESTHEFVQLRVCEAPQQDFKSIIGKELFGLNFAKKSVLVYSVPSIVVPDSMFQRDDRPFLLSFCAELNINDHVLNNSLNTLSAVTVFSLDTQVEKIIRSIGSDVMIIHYTSPFLYDMQQISIRENTTVAGAVFFHNTIFISVCEKGNLLIANHFFSKTAEDCVYWISRCYEEFRMDSTCHKLYLQGVDNLNDSRMEMLKHYFHYVDLLPLPQGYTLTPEFQTHTASTLDLFRLPLCVL